VFKVTRIDGAYVRLALQAATRSVDGSWLAAFRIVFGSLIAVSMFRFIHYGWVERFFAEPTFFFKYWGFEWVPTPSPHTLHGLFAALVGLALCVALGLCFRVTAPLLALGLAYIQLIDVSTYLNHYYLAALLAGLLAASPAHRTWSMDAWLRSRRGATPGDVGVRALWLYLFRFQVACVYIFAGIAKAQPDWLIHSQPLRIWLGASTELPVLGPLLTLPAAPLLMSWCGFLFDSSIVLWLSLPKTRPWAYAVVVVFHVLTRVLFPIGMFPVIMMLAATVFFEPAWPRRVLDWVAKARRVVPGALAARLSAWAKLRTPATVVRPLSNWERVGWVVALSYLCVQVVLPLRFLAYGGNVLWHEQGMRFSWRVMVRAKGGSTTFVATHRETGQRWYVSPREYLTPMQESEMSGQPDLILQLSRHIQADFAARGRGPVAVSVEALTSLNGRRSVPMIDPGVDLTLMHDGIGLANFVLPAPSSQPPHTRPVL
jgi:vitamin K-dependent gamma-carboxylase